MAQDQVAIESILAIDCGSTRTRALLFDRVEGRTRLIARGEAASTLQPPWSDGMVSVRQALTDISDTTGRRFLDRDGQVICPERDGMGVDAVVATTSISEPLRLVLAGVAHQASLDSARRSLPIAAAVVEGLISPDGQNGHVRNDDFEGQVFLLQETDPDAIVMVGGFDGGASEPVLQSARAVAWACSRLPSLQDTPPPVIYAGNADLQVRVARVLGPDAELQLVDNVRPSLEVENPVPLQAAIEELHRKLKIEQLEGLRTLSGWSARPVLPSARALAQTIQFLAKLHGISVAAVDVGGATTTVATVVDDQLSVSVHRDLGLGCNAARLLDQVPLESVLRWLPIELDAAEIYDAVYSKTLHGHTLPQARNDLLLEQAVARENLRLALADVVPPWPSRGSRLRSAAARFDLIVGSGGVLANAPDDGQAALVLLDALQPVGVSVLAVDKAGLLVSAGALASVSPLAAAQLVERDALQELGTVIAPVGSARDGEVALRCQVDYEDGRSLDLEVAYGSLKVIPLPAGQTADLQLRPTRHIDIGMGTGRRVYETGVEGGTVGIIIDARGRPLCFAQDASEQRERVQRWLWDLSS